MLVARMEGNGTLDTVARMRTIFANDGFQQEGAQKALEDLELAFAEIAANAIRHAARKPDTMAVALHLEGNGFRVTFRDDGSPFDGFARVWRESAMAPMDPMAESGRGLWLVRQSTDALDYDHDDGNSWTMSRAFSGEEKPRILLIEDEVATRGLYTALLAKIGETVATASLAEAAEALGEQAFDLIVADFNLGDGQTTALLDTRPDLDAPVIFITGDTSGAARQCALRHGIHMVMQKPIRPLELRERATEALAAHRGHKMRAVRSLAHEVAPLIAARDGLTASGCRLVSRAASATTGGGDLFLDLGEANGRRRFVLADCAGHGMPARMQAAMLAGMMAAQPRDLWSGPAAFLDALSVALAANPLPGNLVATVLVLDLIGQGVVELASAGHPGPLLVGKDGIRQVALEGSLPGLTDSCQAKPRVLRLIRGERLFLATDGLAPMSASQLDGMGNAVEAVLAASSGKTACDAANSIEASVHEAQGTRPADDWTFVLVEAI